MAFPTGSVVVPLTSETMETSCPVLALIRLDFPTLRRPKSEMWVRSPLGVSFSVLMGERGEWNVGILEYWNTGMLEYWNAGILEYWNVGVFPEP